MPTIKNIFKSVVMHLPATRAMVQEVRIELMKRDEEINQDLQALKGLVNAHLSSHPHREKKIKEEVRHQTSLAKVQVKLELREEMLSIEKELLEEIHSLQERVASLQKEIEELRSKDSSESSLGEEIEEVDDVVDEDDSAAVLTEEDEIVEDSEDGAVILSDISTDDITSDPENPILGADDSFYDEFFDKGEFSIVEDEPAEVKEINVIKKKK